MKIPVFFFLLCFAATESFSQANRRDQVLTRVHHYGPNISVSNFDGTRATISANGNFATLSNSDGTQSTIELRRNASTLVAIDGTTSFVLRNRMSSKVYNTDGTQLIISHRKSTSSCSTAYGTHTIMHTFGHADEWHNKNVTEILLHVNWYMQMKAAEETDNSEVEVPLN